jgi:exodeoxyribonuclease-3
MSLTIATWNINSVRLRAPLVERFLSETKPDLLCLQETKCPNDQFPAAVFRKLGYGHIALNGQKGYHGVAILSRHPFEQEHALNFAGKIDSRHISVRLKSGLSVHNFYVPAGGDIPDPEANEKFAHKLTFLDEMRDWGQAERPAAEKAILVGDLNVAPLETDVWSHKQMLDVVSHTPIECEKFAAAIESADWVDAVRHLKPEPERVYTWWSYRAADWAASNRGRRLDHVWVSKDLVGSLETTTIHRDSRSWERPSDHVPVTVTFGAVS